MNLRKKKRKTFILTGSASWQNKLHWQAQMDLIEYDQDGAVVKWWAELARGREVLGSIHAAP